MADMKEKLVELLFNVPGYVISTEELADHLIANGVTLDNQVSSSKWISVKDRLPKPYTRVLVRVNGYKEILVGWYTETFEDSNNEKFDCWSIEYKLSERSMESVTHWMPLPEPPKEA